MNKKSRLDKGAMVTNNSEPLSNRESRIPRPSFGRRSSLPDSQHSGSVHESTVRTSNLRTSRSSFESKASSNADRESVRSGSDSDRVRVTIRLRPLSEREQARGDQEVWKAIDQQSIGVDVGGDCKTKYAFDQVFDATATNKQLYNWSAKQIVGTSMGGLNATIFVYGVTSSGKTHTMTGVPNDPGIVQRAIRDVFKAIEETPDRDFLLRFSMMEIYNEVINDLLDPTRGQLRLREDPSRGFFVEGIKEETLVSAEHALSVVAAGDANRKVSATAYNEGSSRSHTIMRLSIESSERPGPEHDPRIHVARTLSFLNLIDLAGSESARATLTKDHAREGSFINKSLLTLGTVIAKLSDGNAVHLPFRDSKLTRLLQSSMTGSGARVSVIATITPASCQAEETHNTLKFATRAKKIEIHAKRNEILDQSSLILRYQAEIRQLRTQLEDAARGKGVALTVDPLHPEVRNLRERLEEEHQALLQREQDKASLEMRIARLTRIILSSTRITKADSTLGWRYRQLLLQESQGRQGVSNGCEAVLDSREMEDPAESATSDGSAATKWQEWGADQEVASTVASIRSAGDIIPGIRLMRRQLSKPEDSEASREISLLKEQISALAEELDAREVQSSEGSSSQDANDALQVDLQIMSAERDFLEAKIKRGRSQRQALVANVKTLRNQLLHANIQPKVGHVRLDEEDGASCSSDGDEPVSQANAARHGSRQSTDGHPTPQLGANVNSQDQNAQFLADIDGLRADVNGMKAHSDMQEAKLAESRKLLQQVKEREVRLEESLRSSSREAKQLRSEMERLEVANNNLQGYGLDDLSDKQIEALIHASQQATERMQLSLHMRQMQAERQKEARAAAAAAAQQQARREQLAREQQALRDLQAQKQASSDGKRNPIGPYQPMRIALNKL